MKSAEREVETGLGCKIQTPKKKTAKNIAIKNFQTIFSLEQGDLSNQPRTTTQSRRPKKKAKTMS